MCKLWDVASGQCVRTFQGRQMFVWSTCLGADDRYALSAGGSIRPGQDNNIKLWELATGRCMRTFEGHEYGVRSVSLTADSCHVLSGSQDKTLKLWEVASGRCLRTFKGHAGFVETVCLTADDRYALSGSRDHTVKLWALASDRCLRTFHGHLDSVSSACFSADGRYVLSGSEDCTLKLWALDWELEDKEQGDMDEGARQHFVNFLTQHTPYVSTDSSHPEFLVRRGRPVWTREDWLGLLRTLACAGYGWLRPECIDRELQTMTAIWSGPPPFAGP